MVFIFVTTFQCVLHMVVVKDGCNLNLIQSFVVNSIFIKGTLGFPAIKKAKLQSFVVINAALDG